MMIRKLKNWAAVAVIVALLAPTPSYAICETAASAMTAITSLVTKIKKTINLDLLQKLNFIRENFFTAQFEMLQRLNEFDVNFRRGYSALSRDYVSALRRQTNQEAGALIAQAEHTGAMVDAQEIAETMRKKQLLELDAQNRFKPGASTCQLDSAGPGMLKAELMARAAGRGAALDDHRRRTNAVGTISAQGRAGEMRHMFDQYQSYFCNPALGDQGCAGAGMLPGLDRDIPFILWGEKQTLDPGNPASAALFESALRTMISPESPDPIPAGAVDSPAGRMELMARRVQSARLNTVYNVMGEMLGQRLGGSGIDTTKLRAKAGVSAPNASTNASRSEVLNTLTAGRTYDSTWLVGIAGAPEQVTRERGVINATRMIVLDDLSRSGSSRLFMKAAEFSSELDKRMPGTAEDDRPF